jgi:hypothetical protein
LPPRSTPTTSPKPPRSPASTPETASSITTARPGATPSSSAHLRKRGRVRLALEAERLGVDAVDPHIEQVLDARRPQHLAAVAARGHHGRLHAPLPQSVDQLDRRREHLDPVAAHPRLNSASLRRPGRGRSRPPGRRSGRPRASRSRARPGSCARPRGAACRPRRRGSPPRGRTGGTARRRPRRAAQEVVEQLLPGGGVQARGAGDDAVHVEQHRVEADGPSGSPFPEKTNARPVRDGHVQVLLSVADV